MNDTKRIGILANALRKVRELTSSGGALTEDQCTTIDETAVNALDASAEDFPTTVTLVVTPNVYVYVKALAIALSNSRKGLGAQYDKVLLARITKQRVYITLDLEERPLRFLQDELEAAAGEEIAPPGVRRSFRRLAKQIDKALSGLTPLVYLARAAL